MASISLPLKWSVKPPLKVTILVFTTYLFNTFIIYLKIIKIINKKILTNNLSKKIKNKNSKG